MMQTPAVIVAGAFDAAGCMFLSSPGKPAAKVGDQIDVRLSGALAQQFAERAILPEAGKLPPDLEIQFIGVVEQKLSDGRLRVEYSLPVDGESMPKRLVTLSAVVPAEQVVVNVIPAGTATFSSPAEEVEGAEPTLTTEDSEQHYLHLSNCHEVTLRTWMLAEELGE